MSYTRKSFIDIDDGASGTFSDGDVGIPTDTDLLTMTNNLLTVKGDTTSEGTIKAVKTSAQLNLSYDGGSTNTTFLTDSNGDLTVTPSGADTTLASTLYVSDTTEPTGSTGDGSLRTAGGAAIAKNLYVGDRLIVQGSAGVDVDPLPGNAVATFITDDTNYSNVTIARQSATAYSSTQYYNNYGTPAGQWFVGLKASSDDYKIINATGFVDSLVVSKATNNVTLVANLLVNGGNIGLSTDVDLISLSNNQVTINGSLDLAVSGSVINSSGGNLDIENIKFDGYTMARSGDTDTLTFNTGNLTYTGDLTLSSGNVDISGTSTLSDKVTVTKNSTQLRLAYDVSNYVDITCGSSGDLSLAGTGTGLDIGTGYVLRKGGTQLLTSRQTGWTAPTGSSLRTGYATGSATLTQVAQTLKALIDDLITHGVIGA